jgi:hypothetical protein
MTILQKQVLRFSTPSRQKTGALGDPGSLRMTIFYQNDNSLLDATERNVLRDGQQTEHGRLGKAFCGLCEMV